MRTPRFSPSPRTSRGLVSRTSSLTGGPSLPNFGLKDSLQGRQVEPPGCEQGHVSFTFVSLTASLVGYTEGAQ